MKKITFILFLMASLSYSQNTVDSSAGSAWTGFVTATPDCQGGFGFGQPNLAELVTVLDVPGNTITLKPQLTLYDANLGDCVWDNGAGNGGSILEVSTFVEPAGFADQDLTFQGNVTSSTFAAGYTAVAFIKGLDPNAGFSDVLGGRTASLSSTGNFSISATAAELSSTTTPGIIVQYGFAVTGRNAPSASEAALGSVVVTEFILSNDNFNIEQFSVSPNPTKNAWTVEGTNTIDTIEVFDILGKRVLTLNPNNQKVAIDASSLKTGIYIAKLTADGATKTVKLVKN
jgi:hypothetical protein